MTSDQAILSLKAIAKESQIDPEAAHSAADAILCEFLRSLGYLEVVAAWDSVEKWYA